jgi:hypothetical protein
MIYVLHKQHKNDKSSPPSHLTPSSGSVRPHKRSISDGIWDQYLLISLDNSREMTEELKIIVVAAKDEDTALVELNHLPPKASIVAIGRNLDELLLQATSDAIAKASLFSNL